MRKKLDIKDFVLLGRTFDEYLEMFHLDDNLLARNMILDVGSGVSSFCAEANQKGYQVTGSDKVYSFTPHIIEEKCKIDLDEVIDKLPNIMDLYNWNYFKDIKFLRTQREHAYKTFIRDFKQHGTKRYIPTEYPTSQFCDKQFTLTLVSHFLFLYDEHLSYDFHSAVLKELVRITSGEIRIFPLSNLRGCRSEFVDRLMSDTTYFNNCFFQVKKVNYEFINGGNEFLSIVTGSY